MLPNNQTGNLLLLYRVDLRELDLENFGGRAWAGVSTPRVGCPGWLGPVVGDFLIRLWACI